MMAEESDIVDVEEFIKHFTKADGEDLIKEAERAPKTLSILCAGATGVGKSTLLNGLIGCKADHFEIGNSLDRGTIKVTERKIIQKGITITVWDTPGLERSKSLDKKYLQEIKEKCADYDVFLYCIKADVARATELCDEESSLLRFTELFGPDLWKHAVVALTFSNKIENEWEEEAEVYPKKNINVKREFRKRINEWERKVQETLVKKIDREMAERVPILPAGIANCRDLPGYDLWLSRIFVNFDDRMKDDAKYAHLVIYQHRLTDPNKIGSTGLDDLEDQGLVYDNSFKKKIEMAAASLSVGVVSGAVGAGTGATIGALLIGIPSFGAFAGLGLVVGGALGAAVGVGSAAATTALIQWYLKKKKQRKIGKEQQALKNSK